MKIRAFATVAAAALLLVASPAPSSASAAPLAPVTATDEDDTTRPTVNEFLPEQRPLGDCLGALQRPNCGSEARGGWAQTAVFVAILGGLAFIAWRIVVASRRSRAQVAGAGSEAVDVTPGTPGATSAPDASGGDPTP